MASIVILIPGITASDPHDKMQIECRVLVENSAATFTMDVYVPFTDSAEDINDAIRMTCADRAATLGHPVGPNDKVRLFGGAHSDET